MAEREPEGSNPPAVNADATSPPASGYGSSGYGSSAYGSQATPSQPATPYVKVTSVVDEPITPRTGSLGTEGGKAAPLVKPPDLEERLTRENARSEAALRPVEVMLRDPLGEVARKERRSLLGISAIAILVGRTGLVPAKIENFGISFAAPERKALLWVFFAVVLYYTAAFVVYALSDFLSYLYAVHQGRLALRKQRDVQSPTTSSIFDTPPSIDTPCSFVRFVTPASHLRGVFDFIIPLVIALFAMSSLWGAVHQVTTTVTPSATAPPAVAPVVPHGTTSTLKVIPHR